MASGRLTAFWNHPAGPKTIHFWAPTFKWGITIANIADFSKPPEVLSYPQQLAVTATGTIWSRYSMVINPTQLIAGKLMMMRLTVLPSGLVMLSLLDVPNFKISVFVVFVPTILCLKNWNLFSVNIVMAATGVYQLSRKLRHDYMIEGETSLEKSQA